MDMADKISSRQEFISFLETFRRNLIENPDEWENKNLEDFLEAMIRYTDDLQGYYDNTKQTINADMPDWQVFADILAGARIYE
jgi:hypothetical protein